MSRSVSRPAGRCVYPPGVESAAAEPAPAGRYTVDAAARALSLLDAFSVSEPTLPLADLIRRPGLPRATALRPGGGGPEGSR